MTESQHDEDWLWPKEAATILHVEPRTVANWAAAGKVSVLVLPSGHRRYRRSEIEALAQPKEITE